MCHIKQTFALVTNAVGSKNKCLQKLTRSQKHIYDLLAGDLKLMLEIAMKANQRLLVVCSARPLNAHQAGNSWLSLARW